MQPDRGPMAATNDKLDEVLFELMQLNLYVRDMLVAERAERPAPIIEVSSPAVDLSPLTARPQPRRWPRSTRRTPPLPRLAAPSPGHR